MRLVEPLVLSTQRYDYLADAMCSASPPLHRGHVERRRFPDHERYQRIEDEVDGRAVVVVGGTIGDDDTLELYDLASAASGQGAQSLALVIPYFGYSTMERAVRPGEVVTAKTRARLLSSIPPAALGNQVFLLDLHSEGIPHYFEQWTRAVHIYAKPVIQSAIQRLGGDDFVLACTDAGRAKWVESLASDLGVDAAFIIKRRLDGERTEVAQVNANVSGRRVVLYDDMIRTGGSLIGAARAYLDAGATEVAAVTTHAVLPDGALERLQSSGVFSAIVGTDSHPRARELESSFFTVESIAGLIADKLVGAS